jgi:periodic tryptophan protein 1
MSSMITTTTWVPRGFAAPFPTKYNFDEEEFERIASLAKLQLDDAKEDLEEAQENEATPEKSSGKKEQENKPSAEDDNASEFVTALPVMRSSR